MPSSTNTLIATSTNRPLYPSTPQSDAEGARQRRVSAMIDSAMGRIPDSPLIAIVGVTSPAAASPSAVGTPQHPPMYRRRRMTNAGSHRHASSTSGIGAGGQRRVSLAASHMSHLHLPSAECDVASNSDRSAHDTVAAWVSDVSRSERDADDDDSACGGLFGDPALPGGVEC
jgi:hypothetical protein